MYLNPEVITLLIGFEDTVTGHAGAQSYIIPFSEILRETVRVEENCDKVVTFSVRGADSSNFNIKFKNAAEASHFARYQVTSYKSHPPPSNLH